MGLSALERETVITMCDGEDFATISSSQRKVVTQLLKNPTATIVDDRVFEGTRIVTATLPQNGITVRKAAKGNRATSKRQMPISAATCKGVKADGKKCNSIAKAETGYCNRHQDQAK